MVSLLLQLEKLSTREMHTIVVLWLLFTLRSRRELAGKRTFEENAEGLKF